jgi:Phosphorylated adapter RNA export protein, RNA-binding domain
MPEKSITSAALTVADFAVLLDEVKLVLLRRCLLRLGSDRCEALPEQTLAVEDQGGLLRRDGQRRTPGGTFFQLVKAACSPEERRSPFFRTSPRPPCPPRLITPSTWAMLEQLKRRISRTHRGAGTMKMTFVGLPGRIAHDRTCVLFRVQISPPTHLPQELPSVLPADMPPWTVVVPGALWLKKGGEHDSCKIPDGPYECAETRPPISLVAR